LENPGSAALLKCPDRCPTLRRKIVVLLFAVVIVLFVGLLFAVDRTLKVGKRVRRRREANRRLVAAAAVAEAANKQRTATAEASKALTSLIPAIHDHDIRHVE
jgi:hypothetical protein